VEARVNGSGLDDIGWLQFKPFPGQGGGGWRNGYLTTNPDEIEQAWRIIQRVFHSWD
jgi:hypothetical protein